ncbi:unnamed protein product [Bursaphelenchus okinawaensis]|uniref:Uncharacterized protein n=1 Tax=Bursaphelenchus okinawaensis TaxID=465554 RepID=A0A811LA52_9BILA|nr:unnamed protein product [Bursaphelenchus okinawaensis]CAG9121906.1 unnamed protein product [Bursaphelenchus okinawaensis]
MDSEGPSTSINSSDQTEIYIDNCVGALAEVPSTFDYGTLKVRLCSISVSGNFISIGSECGALFLYNRRLKRALKPLRTTYNEVVTVQKWYHLYEDEFLAVGHRSGSLIVLSLPSSTKSLKQTIQNDLHKHCAVTALEWSKNGKYLFSSDASGLVMALTVDFSNDQFTPIFIQNNGNPLRMLAFEPDYLISVESKQFGILHFEHDQITHVHEQDVGQKVTGIQLFESILSMVLADGKLIRFSTSDLKMEITVDLADITVESELMPQVFVSGEIREAAPCTWTKMDWKFAVSQFYANCYLLQYSQHKVQVLDVQRIDTPLQLYVIDLRSQLPSLRDVEIISVDFDPKSEETLVLTSSKHILRVGFEPGDAHLLGKTSNSSMFSSISSVAQSSSRKWFQKFTKPEGFQEIQAGHLPSIQSHLPQSLSGTLQNFINIDEQKQRFTNVLESIERIVSPDKAPVQTEFVRPFEDVGRISDSEEVTEESEFESDRKDEITSRNDGKRSMVLGKQSDIEDGTQSIADSQSGRGLGSDGREDKGSDKDGTANGVINGDIETKMEGKEVKEEWKEVEVLSEKSEQEQGGLVPEFKPIAVEEPKVGVVRKMKTKPRPKHEKQMENERKFEDFDEKLTENEVFNENLGNILGAISKSKVLSEDVKVVPLPHWVPTDHGYGDEIIVEEPEVTVSSILSAYESDNGIKMSDFGAKMAECGAKAGVCDEENQDSEAENDGKEGSEVEKDEEENFEASTSRSGDSEDEEGRYNKKNGRKETKNHEKWLKNDREPSESTENLNLEANSVVESTESSIPVVDLVARSDSVAESDVTLISNVSSSISVEIQQNPEYSTVSRLANQRTDVWNRINLPYSVGHFDVTTNYIVICGTKSRQKPHYRLVETMENAMLGGDWTPVGYKADMVAVNDFGTLLWRIEKGVALAPIKVDSLCPLAKHWLEQANEGKIYDIALTEKSAWYLTSKGPYVQMNLPDMGILYHAECPFELDQITATEHAVWGLRKGTGSLVVRVGLKHCPMGMDWVEDSSYTFSGPSTFVSIYLYEKTAFGLDSNGELWICNGVDEHKPFGVGKWYQVCSPTNLMLPNQKKSFLPISQWRLKVAASGVFISVGKYILSSRQPLTAHIFNRAIPTRLQIHDAFLLITASGFSGESNDYIYVGQPNSDIFAFSASHRNLTSMPGLDQRVYAGLGQSAACGTVIALTAAKDRLYALDSCGTVSVRDGINSQLTPRGTEWVKLNVVGLGHPIMSFAASSTSLWAITSDGTIWTSPQSSKASFTNWSRVTGPKNENIDHVFCSPSGKYVWILSTLQGVAWARLENGQRSEEMATSDSNRSIISGFDRNGGEYGRRKSGDNRGRGEDKNWHGEYQVSHGEYSQYQGEHTRDDSTWTKACPDIKIESLAIADNAVYAIENGTNKLFRLRALSATNPAGLYWKSIPATLRAISVDGFEQRLWGLDMNNCLVKHEIQIFPRSCLPQHKHQEGQEDLSQNSSQSGLFKVFDDEPQSSMGSDWFDAERDQHEP